VYYHKGEQWYEQFLQVGRLDRALILLGLAFVSVIFMALLLLFVTFFTVTSTEPRDWPFTWLTNHCCDTVGWHIWPVKSSHPQNDHNVMDVKPYYTGDSGIMRR